MLCIIYDIKCTINTLYCKSYVMLCLMHVIQCIICRLFCLVMLSCIIDWAVLCRDYHCQDSIETITMQENYNNNNNFWFIWLMLVSSVWLCMLDKVCGVDLASFSFKSLFFPNLPWLSHSLFFLHFVLWTRTQRMISYVSAGSK